MQEKDKCQLTLTHSQTFVTLFVFDIISPLFTITPVVLTHQQTYQPTSSTYLPFPLSSPQTQPRNLDSTFWTCITYHTPSFSLPLIAMPSTESSSGSLSDTTFRSRLADTLHITGYHFVNATRIPSVDRYNNNICLVNGYRYKVTHISLW